MGRKPKQAESPRGTGRVDLSAEVVYRLDILAAHRSLERKAKGLGPISRSGLVTELLLPHLKEVVVSIRSGRDESTG